MDLTEYMIPALSAILGGLFSAVASYVALRVELAILRTKIEALSESISGMKDNIDEAHRRIDGALAR
jgi:hypothetical protein